MGKVFLKDISLALAKKKGIDSAEAEEYLNVFFTVIEEALSAEKVVKIKGFGTFKLVEVRDRESVDVNTGERVVIEGHDKVTFTPENSLKELVNKPFSQFETVELNDGVEFDKETSDTLLSASNAGNSENAPIETIDSKIEIEEVPDDKEESDDIEYSDNKEETAFEKEISEQPIAGHPDAPTNEEIQTNESPIFEEDNENETITLPLGQYTETLCEKTAEDDDDAAENNSPSGNDEMSSDDDTPEVSTTDSISENPIKKPAEASVTEDLEEHLATEDQDEHPDLDDVYISKKKHHGFIKVLYAVLIIALIAGVFFAGFYLGERKDSKMISEVQKSEASINEKPIPNRQTVAKKAVAASIDTLAAKAQPAETSESVIGNADKEPETHVDKKESERKDSETPALVMSAAETMVRTGAYNIIGTDKTVTVKAGQTMKSLAKRYLGEGMECYIQVHNRKSEVREGETINIPKLQLKKKGRNKKVS